MSDEEEILRAVVAPKSNQLNADDLQAGEVTVQIVSVRMSESGEQQTTVEITGGFKPWKPCKSMVRVMLATWGRKWRTEWPGNWVTLYRDPTVTFGDKNNPVGGIRVKAMTGLQKPTSVMLTAARGVKKPFLVQPLTPPTSGPARESAYATFVATLAAKGIDANQVAEWRGITHPDQPALDTMSAAWLEKYAAALLADGSALMADFRKFAGGGGK